MMKNVSSGVERIIRALLDTLKPRKPGFDPLIEDDIIRMADAFLGGLPVHMKILMPLGLRLLNYATLILMFPTWRTFCRMSREKREKYIMGWAESSIPLRRDLIKGFKAIVLTGFYTHPIVLAHLGMDLEAHLKRINVQDINTPPTVACSEEAARYFTELEKKGEWGPSGGLPGHQIKYLSPKEVK